VRVGEGGEGAVPALEPVDQPPREPLLRLEDVHVSYGDIPALQGVSLEVAEGEIVTLIGANGAGKTTTLRAASRLLPLRRGRITFRGRPIDRLAPHQLVAEGMVHVPEGRGILANLTVAENLLLATYARRDRDRVPEDLERVFFLFPRLAERRRQLAGTLSGGEQQMLAIGRALMTRARLILLDEPSMGLAPRLVAEVFRVLQAINRQGCTLLLVEQNARLALQIAHRGYVMETGRIVLSGPAARLAADPRVRAAYLGG